MERLSEPGAPAIKECNFEPCTDEAKLKGWCRYHYQQQRKGRELRQRTRIMEAPQEFCDFDACDRAPRGKRGYCHAHAEQLRKSGELKPIRFKAKKYTEPCGFETCNRPIRSRGYCASHYSQLMTVGTVFELRDLTPKFCSFEGCDRRMDALGWCNAHIQQWRMDPDAMRPIGAPNPKKRAVRDATRKYSRYGYVKIYRPKHPNANRDGWISEHRAVMVEKIGRPLYEKENVHHINGVRDDNRPENLELWSTSQPCGQRVEDKVAWAKELLALYEPEALA